MFLLPGFGFGAAASTMVGQNLGAKNPARAEKSALLIVGYYFALAVAFAIPLFIFSGTVARIFTTDEPTIVLLSEFIRYLAVCSISPGMMFSQSLQGAGTTIYPMLGVIATLYGIQVPLAWYLGVHLHMEATGIWIANLASGFANAALMSVIFLGGRWKRKRYEGEGVRALIDIFHIFDVEGGNYVKCKALTPSYGLALADNPVIFR